MADTKSEATTMFERMFLLGAGVVSLTKEKVEGVVDELVERGQLSREEGSTLVDDLRERGAKEKEAFAGFVNDQISAAIDRSDLASKRDVAKLRAEIADLKKDLAAAKRTARPKAAPKTAPKKQA